MNNFQAYRTGCPLSTATRTRKAQNKKKRTKFHSMGTENEKNTNFFRNWAKSTKFFSLFHLPRIVNFFPKFQWMWKMWSIKVFNFSLLSGKVSKLKHHEKGTNLHFYVIGHSDRKNSLFLNQREYLVLVIIEIYLLQNNHIK